ncbi:MAG: GxxExxY protein [Methylotenera sp. 24-45-7]|jgi:GxxExxY protein|nr:MAG: GxxExxY protein [Methylophilales bacterium 16-45-9]OYZ41025.1 MAG: GxxExxY protein [Methylotenera sp. 24-45-7]OZA08634.1 MAG: GxxExxY protein [Methylotenera sp. 17-45-7]OZA54324.1 MAG: GxxExxY protein [Methylophilales bacterium 39-45-7]HQS36931.1 GxxExxY protein [Methylotenera sp.]
MDADKTIETELTQKIIGCAYTVSNTLGSGFLEKVYENALVIELRKNKLAYQQQSPVKVIYDNIVVGEYISDLVIESKVLIELKACKAIDDTHVAQCLNYLKAANLQLGLIINFGKPKIEIRRLVL